MCSTDAGSDFSFACTGTAAPAMKFRYDIFHIFILFVFVIVVFSSVFARFFNFVQQLFIFIYLFAFLWFLRRIVVIVTVVDT